MQAGLFSAVTSGFIIQFNSQLQPDPGDDTVALLRVLIYKIDNTTFGGNVPSLPQWTGPPGTIVGVQGMLYASLCASLFSAFLAMLGKQWLTRYDSIDVRGSVVERSQNRQRKLDGIDAWYFYYVMELLPLLLQVSLFLFSFGLSLNLDDTIDASVVFWMTMAGYFVYSFMVIAAVAFENCPYQTPLSRTLRFVGPKILKIGLPDVVYPWSRGPPSTPLTHETTMWHLRCISWTLHTSLDKNDHLSALKHLASVPELFKFRPTLVVDCFRIFTSCLGLGNNEVAIMEGGEQLAVISAKCFLRTLHHLSVTDSTSRILADLRQEYSKIFPPDIDFRGLPFCNTMTMIHIVITEHLTSWKVQWDDGGPFSQERIPFAWCMAEAARVGYLQSQCRKVPRWILRFALDSLSLDPPPPGSVVTDCLRIIAIDLGCDISNLTTPDERYV